MNSRVLSMFASHPRTFRIYILHGFAREPPPQRGEKWIYTGLRHRREWHGYAFRDGGILQYIALRLGLPTSRSQDYYGKIRTPGGPP